ncbi:ABC transporter ATP-binding protein [Nocardioides ginsengisoli]|uniref:ABC transporter ATP-binding protein n=1 Tax=Nocardioides ginsengisoli TaxID=363868 RepID=A0ABW3W7B6_9ACTN
MSHDETAGDGPPVVGLEHVTRTYRGNPPVAALQDATFSIRRGDLVTIVGRSGSGKSTLLNILGLLDRPSSGRFVLDGHDVTGLSQSQRTSLRGMKVGFVHQSFQLLAHRSALENVALATLYRGDSSARSRSRATAALAAVGLEARQDQLPSAMSGGERQRVAIARAIAGEPALLLCDEPTGNLDTHNGAAVVETLLARNASGVTIVLITHDRELALIGNRHFEMSDGRIREKPSPGGA